MSSDPDRPNGRNDGSGIEPGAEPPSSASLRASLRRGIERFEFDALLKGAGAMTPTDRADHPPVYAVVKPLTSTDRVMVRPRRRSYRAVAAAGMAFVMIGLVATSVLVAIPTTQESALGKGRSSRPATSALVGGPIAKVIPGADANAQGSQPAVQKHLPVGVLIHGVRSPEPTRFAVSGVAAVAQSDGDRPAMPVRIAGSVPTQSKIPETVQADSNTPQASRSESAVANGSYSTTSDQQPNSPARNRRAVTAGSAPSNRSALTASTVSNPRSTHLTGLPDSDLTPGDWLDSAQDQTVIPDSVRRQVSSRYGLHGDEKQYVYWRLIPAEIGGRPTEQNVFPMTPWQANLKLRLDTYLAAEVKGGRMTAEQAVHELTGNWIKAVHKHRLLNYGKAQPDETIRN